LSRHRQGKALSKIDPKDRMESVLGIFGYLAFAGLFIACAFVLAKAFDD
jgi:hypothetical protein